MKPYFVPSARLTAAFDYARRLHRKQTRKRTKITYLSHLMAVAALVIEHGGTEDQAIAALLHDAIEDQNHHGSVPGQIEKRFGSKVRALVEACSDSQGPKKEEWRLRKEAYLKHLACAPGNVCLISAADKLHNARAILADYRAIGRKVWRRFNAGQKDQLWYYNSLVKAFRRADPRGRSRPIVDELDRVVRALKKESA